MPKPVVDRSFVDEHTGEYDCPGCAIKQREIGELKDVQDGLHRKLHGVFIEIAELRRDIEEDAKNDPLYEQAKELFDFWRKECKHAKSRFSADRFAELRPMLKKYGPEKCRLAIEGAAFDCATKERKNGTIEFFNDWELIFRSSSKLESFACRSPRFGKVRKPEARATT